MSGFELVVGVIGIFFTVGIAVGVLLVTALPQFRRRRNTRIYADGGERQRPPALGEDDKSPRWPGA
jgi:hypothetical protein